MKEKMKKVLMLILVLICIACAGYLVWYYCIMPDEEDAAQTAEKYQKQVEDKEEDAPVEIPIDFEALKQVNPEVHAWIRIEGTPIDYPIVQSQTDDEYYLNHTWENQYAESGAIFTQSYNSTDFTDYNTVIYGHRMGDGNNTMFHDVRNYMDMEYLKAHQEIIVYTEDHIRTYKVFAAVVYDDRLIPRAFDFMQEDERQLFLDSLHESGDVRNQFAEDVEVTKDDHMITLSTCLKSEPHHRFIVGAVLVDEK